MEEEKKSKSVEIVSIATETQEVFQVDGELMNLNQYLSWMGNLLVKLRKGLIKE
jgi:hypothetical protein